MSYSQLCFLFMHEYIEILIDVKKNLLVGHQLSGLGSIPNT